MDTIFMNSEKSKTSEPYKLLLKLTDKISINRSDKYAAFPNLIMYYTCKNIKKSYKRNRLEISGPTWNGKFQLPDGSYFVSDIQQYFEYV